ncbi:hypothetical protein BGX28_000967 [Mortierella sp. GBA30]|nr:hypothetical protein BGX28_000967 [Mortierella sp. GBA30]
MSSSDTTPLLSGQHPRRTSLPISNSNNHISSGLPYTNPALNPNNNNNQRHWSEETEDILGPDPNAYGHQNTGAGYRRRGPPPPLHPSSELDAQRFSGQDRPTGLKRLFYGCCCYPCRRVIFNFQTKYSKLEKYSMAIAGVCFILAVAFFCAYVRAREALPQTGKNGICTSRGCTIVAADILRDMKPEVDPCTDFFAFSCGGFVDRVSIPDDKAQIGYFTLVKQANQASILSTETNSLQHGTKDDASKRNLVKLQSLYESCMDEKRMTEVGVKPLKDLIQKMIKVFPGTLSVLDSEIPASSLLTSMDSLRAINVGFTSRYTEKLELEQEQRFSDQDDEYENEHEELDEMWWPPPQNQENSSPVNMFVGDELRKRKEEGRDSTNAKAGREELALAITQLAWVGVSTVVDFDVDSDPKNPESNIFKLDESGLGLPSKEYYDEDKIVAVYQKAVEEMFAVVLGKDQKDSLDSIAKPVVWAEVAKNVVEFEKLLAAISSDPADLENSEFTYNPRTLSEITEIIPTIDWPLVMEKLLNGSPVPDPIIVSSPDFLEKLNALLKDTPAMTLQNYFAWRLIQKHSPSLAVELRKPMQELKAALQGVSADLVSPRWETCVDVVDSALGAMAGHYFIERAFKGDSKEMADGVITSLRSTFLKGLNRLDWLDKETLSNATEKVDLLIQKTGFSVESPDVRSSESLEDYFKDLGIDKADFFGNQIRSKTWSLQQAMNLLGKPVDKAKWLMSPQTVNAYYNPSVNEIVFPAGILQQPFFHGDNPEYLNYGGIGVVAGHELTHAFDNEGRLYDARGKLSDWWSNSTLEEFKTKSQCYVDQYGNFTVKDPQGRENHVNGRLTLGENLADNGGLKTSFEAWQTRFNSDPHGNKYKNHLLSGLEDYSREQLFYLSFARVWCSDRRAASAIEGLRTDVHAPAKWRVNGAVQNSQHFAEVFNCKPRSTMNPDTKCDMW